MASAEVVLPHRWERWRHAGGRARESAVLRMRRTAPNLWTFVLRLHAAVAAVGDCPVNKQYDNRPQNCQEPGADIEEFSQPATENQ